MTGLEDAIAIVGFAGRFPGADSVAEFWENLKAGRSTLTRFGDDELLAAGVPPETVGDEHYVPVRGVLRDVEGFDAELFGMMPRDAALTDPQQRLMLECARTALESAGYPPESCPARVGVYLGATTSTYLPNHVLPSGIAAQVGEVAVRLATDNAFLATRVAHKLDLRGPAMTVQTACSTSLVAVHLAGQALLCGEAELALAGGVSITVPQVAGQWHTPNGIISASGRLRSFDAGADGTVGGNGGAVVLLKLAEAALADGDPVHALILGSAVNNDGGGKLGFTAPAAAGQAEVITLAHRVAGVDPGDISYVEAHATGTELGDPVEVAALTEAFRRGTDRAGHCVLGSVKPNIGHLDAAAGVAGLLKAVLALREEVIPPTAGFERANPHIPFDGSPFRVTAAPTAWPRVAGAPRRCGVSSFGIGGTNAHVVLQEAPATTTTGQGQDDRRPVVLPLSARTGRALGALARATTAALPPLPDAAFTLQTGRTEFGHRTAVVAGPGDTAAELHARLIGAARAPRRVREVVFLFPGQGTFRPGLLSELATHSETVRALTERGSAVLGEPALTALLRDEAAAAPPWLGQVALFVTGYALARVLADGGIRPTAVLGHSLGEYTAACVAGAASFDEMLALVARRARALTATPAGAMLAVAASERRVRALLAGQVWISGVHGPESVVVAGAPDAVRALAGRLAAEAVHTVGIEVEHAYHTPLIAPALAELREAADAVRWRPLTVPLFTTLTGKPLPEGTVPATEHWTGQTREPVRLADAVAGVLGLPEPVLLELGPGQVLTDVARRLGGAEEAAVFPVGRKARSGVLRERDLLGVVAGYWTAGGRVDWAAFRTVPGRRVPMATYPFQRERHWIEPRPAPAPAAPGPVPVPAVPVRDPDEVTAAVRQIWVELIGHDRFSPADSFLDLGGNSLTAVQMLTRLRDRFGVKVSLHSLFDRPTVAGIAGLVSAGLTGAAAE
ncbi:type I polyketide synthase [Amycolatopsis sp. lyj-346]|uniref:type I polyketide synthase n=1 Tax=Amycolatopsis sp. lyj-346 TaxID=2789289 RepID=UPI003978AC5B